MINMIPYNYDVLLLILSYQFLRRQCEESRKGKEEEESAYEYVQRQELSSCKDIYLHAIDISLERHLKEYPST